MLPGMREKKHPRVGLELNWQPKEWIGFRWAERRNDVIGLKKKQNRRPKIGELKFKSKFWIL